MSSQQADSCSPQTAAPLQLSLQPPGRLSPGSNPILHSQPSPIPGKASQAAGHPAQQCAMPHGLVLASTQDNLVYQAPQPQHYQRASLQQQQLAYMLQPPKQQIAASAEIRGGYAAAYPSSGPALPIKSPAESHAWMDSTANGVASQSKQAELAPAAVPPSEQPVAYPYAPPPSTAAAAAAIAVNRVPSNMAEATRSHPPSIYLGTAQAAAPAPVAAAAETAAAAVVSEMSLERYLDLHAALERGTGSVQSFSAVEAGMFRMADLKQARVPCDIGVDLFFQPALLVACVTKLGLS